MLGGLLLILCAPLCFLLLFLFFRYYGMRVGFNSTYLHEILIIIFSYIPILMGVAITAYEISKFFPLDNPSKLNNFVIAIQYILYYTTMIISFFANPFINEFKKITNDRPDETLKTRVIESFKQLAIYYGVIAVLAVLLIFSIIASHVKFSFSVLLGILPSILNLYGLIMYIFAIGFGIIKIPLNIWHRGMPVNLVRDYCTEIEDISNRRSDDPRQALHFQNLLLNCKNEYDNIILLNLRLNPKKIGKAALIYLLSILSGLFSFLHIVNEGSFGYRNDENCFVLRKILNGLHFQVLDQLFLFIYIGILVSVAAHMLTCISFKSLFPELIGNYLSKVFNIIEYKFTKGETSTNTFECWSTYLQRLVPTIAYHCQIMAGVSGSSLERLFGQLSHFDVFTILIKMTLPSFLLIIIVFVIVLSFDNIYDKDKVEKGLAKFKEQMNIPSRRYLDDYIINDNFDRNRILGDFPEREPGDEINLQLSSISSIQNPVDNA